MNNITTFSIALLSMAVVVLSSCKDQSKRSAPDQKPQSGESVDSEYPRMYEKRFDKDNEVELSSSWVLGVHPKLLSALEVGFNEHLASCKPEDETIFGIQSSAEVSLVIRFSPTPAGDSRTMIAIWKRPEKEETTGEEIFLTRHSEPLDSEAEALALLKSYSSLDPEFESLAKWKGKGP